MILKKLRARAEKLVDAVRTTCSIYKMSVSRQDNEYYLLQQAHRLEKGLLYTNPRKLWGRDKALKMAALLSGLVEHDKFYYRTAMSVLYKYIQAKKASAYPEDTLLAAEIEDIFAKKNVPLTDYGCGGVLSLTKNEVMMTPYSAIKDVLSTRHSIRSFSDEPVTKEEINEAVRLALRAPSACNRQAFRVYVSDKSCAAICNKPFDIQGEKFLVITGIKTAYNNTELFDWIVSAGIFSGYLSLTLHSLGIGCSVLKKTLKMPQAEEKAIKAYLAIPENEQLCAEIAIGHYPESFSVPYSNRKEPEDVVVFK
ncbi:MAG: nitroreductase family protein [Abditibacteriota bacterium]|nr:nitroreductase family protein [Abditibacteriota bacterium]